MLGQLLGDALEGPTLVACAVESFGDLEQGQRLLERGQHGRGRCLRHRGTPRSTRPCKIGKPRRSENEQDAAREQQSGE
jgi:hypothetical protein